MKIRISRRTFVILLILFIFTLAFLALSLFVGFLFNRDSKELTFPSSNVEYTKWQLPDGAKARLGKGTINDIKFSPDGTQFAVATTIGVWLYDAKSGNEVSLLKGDRHNILHITYLSDGSILRGVINSYNYLRVIHWNTTTGKHLSSIQDTENGKYLYTSDFSENGMRLAGIEVSKYNEVALWTIGNTTIPMTKSSIKVEFKSKIESVIALSQDGSYLATTISDEDDNTIQVWDADTGELLNTFAGNNSTIEGLTFSPDGTILASGDSNETIMLWDLVSNASREIYKGTYSSSFTLAFSADGELLAIGDDDGNVRILKVNDNENDNGLKRLISQNMFTHSRHKDKVTSLVFSPDSKMLISGSEDGTIRGWDVPSRNQLFVRPGHAVKIDGLAELKAENNLISMHWPEKQILRWDIKTGHQVSGTYFFIKSPKALSPDANTLVVEEWFPFLKDDFIIWNIPNRRKTISLKVHNYNLSSSPDFVFSLDGKMLASSDFRDQNGDILMWNLENAKRSFLQTIFFRPKSANLTHTLSGHTDTVHTMVFSPNGKMLASSGYDKRLCLWNVQTTENIFTQEDHSVSGDALIFSPDSKVLASGSSTRIVLWDTTTGLQIKKTKAQDVVNILQYSPDNKVLLSGSYKKGRIQLFDAQFLQHISTHQGHTGRVIKLMFLSDGKSLVSSGADGTMLLWDWNRISQVNNSQ